MIIRDRANAKINLFLRICDVLPGGYHRLFLSMQEISLADEISVEFGNSSDDPVININSEADCPVEKDLCYRAARLFYDEFAAGFSDRKNMLQDITITEVKNTPSQAGLGGGSSDAATVIRILQEHYDKPFALDKLLDMAKSLGADVPFFLYGGSCLCEGIGEIITPVPSLAGLNLLLVKPKEGVPTGECFRLSDSRERVFDEKAYYDRINEIFRDTETSPLEKVKQAAPILTNDLQDSAMELVPVIGNIIDEIRKTAPVYCAMSGSGSCVFAVYDSSESRSEARSRLNLEDCLILECQTL